MPNNERWSADVAREGQTVETKDAAGQDRLGERIKSINDGLETVRGIMRQMEEDGQYEGSNLWDLGRVRRDMKDALQDHDIAEERESIANVVAVLARDKFRIVTLEMRNTADDIGSSDARYAQETRARELNSYRAARLFEELSERYKSGIETKKYQKDQEKAFNDLQQLAESLKNKVLFGHIGHRIDMFLDVFKNEGLANQKAILEMDEILESLAEEASHCAVEDEVAKRNNDTRGDYFDDAAYKDHHTQIAQTLPLLRDLGIVRDQLVRAVFGALKTPSEVSQLTSLKQGI